MEELTPLKSSYLNKKILITGASGFLGRHLVVNLKDHGYKNLILPSHKEYELTRPQRIQALLKKWKPQVIIHCAAKVGGIGANQKYPGSFFYENSVMGVHLMEEARIHKVEKFVAIGTVCCYPKWTQVPFKEDDLWNGYPEETNASYGLSKKMMLVQSQAYRIQYGFNSIFLVPVNLYGPGDNFDPDSSHVIPALIVKFFEAMKNGKKQVVVWGDGSSSREFLYVEECAQAIRLAMERYDKSLPINLGIGEEITIKSLAEKIGKLAGFQGKIVWDSSKPNGQPRRSLDVSRAYEEFGFKAKVPIDEGLKKVMQWYRSI